MFCIRNMTEGMFEFTIPLCHPRGQKPKDLIKTVYSRDSSHLLRMTGLGCKSLFSTLSPSREDLKGPNEGSLFMKHSSTCYYELPYNLYKLLKLFVILFIYIYQILLFFLNFMPSDFFIFIF